MEQNNQRPSQFLCGHCKQGFNSENFLILHIVEDHPKVRNIGIYRCIDQLNGSGIDEEKNFAARAIQAETDMRSGRRTDDSWLLGR